MDKEKDGKTNAEWRCFQGSEYGGKARRVLKNYHGDAEGTACGSYRLVVKISESE